MKGEGAWRPTPLSSLPPWPLLVLFKSSNAFEYTSPPRPDQLANSRLAPLDVGLSFFLTSEKEKPLLRSIISPC